MAVAAVSGSFLVSVWTISAGDAMKAISYEFLDWVRATVVGGAAGVLGPELVFDEREKGFAQHIQKSVNSGLGCCVVVSLADLRQVGSGPDDTQYRVEVYVSVLRNAGLAAEVDSVLLAEHLFRLFAGAAFEPMPCGLPVTVQAGSLTHQVNGLKFIHTFEVSYLTTIISENYV